MKLSRMCICLRLNPTSVRFFPFELRGIDRIILSQRGKRASSTGSESYRRWQGRTKRGGAKAAALQAGSCSMAAEASAPPSTETSP